MDQSLEDYIFKKRVGDGNSRLANRLGVKVSPQKVKKNIQLQTKKGNRGQFHVTGLGNVKFDARTRIIKRDNLNGAKNVPQDARAKIAKKGFIGINVKQKITGPGDARQKILLTKNARQKITGPNAQNVQISSVGHDLRVKVNNIKAKKIDARDKIKANRSAKVNSGQQQVIVTGLGQPIPTLVSRVPTNASSNLPNQGGKAIIKNVGGNLRKTIPTQSNASTLNQIRNTGRIATKNMNAQGLKVTTRQQVDATSVKQLPGNDNLNPMVRITNDHYVPPRQQQQYSQQPYHQEQNVYHSQTPQYAQYATSPVYSEMEPSSVQQQAPVVVHHYREPDPPQIIYQQPPLPSQHQPVIVINPQPQSSQEMYQAEEDHGPFRVMVTNLHPVVSQDDLVELFGSIGALKRARLVKPGIAEVLYMRRDDAMSACKKYHMRELDGQPMQVNMTSLTKTKVNSPVKKLQKQIKMREQEVVLQPKFKSLKAESKSIKQEFKPLALTKVSQHSHGLKKQAVIESKPTAPKRRRSPIRTPYSDEEVAPVKVERTDRDDEEQSQNFQPLRLGESSKPGPSKMNMEMVHKALFKTQTPGQANRPVTFTVKI